MKNTSLFNTIKFEINALKKYVIFKNTKYSWSFIFDYAQYVHSADSELSENIADELNQHIDFEYIDSD